MEITMDRLRSGLGLLRGASPRTRCRVRNVAGHLGPDQSDDGLPGGARGGPIPLTLHLLRPLPSSIDVDRARPVSICGRPTDIAEPAHVLHEPPRWPSQWSRRA
jgi:hypothetical protein